VSDEARDRNISPLPRRWVTWAVAGGLLAIAVVSLGVLIGTGRPGSPGGVSDDAILAVVPEPDSQAPRQSRVGVRLDSAWTLDLMVIGGRAIPPDQIDNRESLNEWFFEPGPGKALERLEAGRVCVAVNISRVVDPPDERTNGWCFDAV
jgi:hypothetical protein